MQDRVARCAINLEPTGDRAIRFEKVTLAAGGCDIISNVDLTVAGSRPTALLGPNGSGKSTLIKLAMGLAFPTSGRIVIDAGADEPPPRLAIVFQKPVMLRRSAAANVAFALKAAGRSSDPRAVYRLLDQAGLTALAEAPARRLSGGEQQRLALARALAGAPDILMLDEPTASLDPAATKTVEDIVATIAAQGVKIILATHNLGQARRIAGDVVLLVRGRVAEHSGAAQFFSRPASEAGRRFVAGDLVL